MRSARLEVRIDLPDMKWLTLGKWTHEDNTTASANFNWDDDIDNSKLEEAIKILEEAVL